MAWNSVVELSMKWRGWCGRGKVLGQGKLDGAVLCMARRRFREVRRDWRGVAWRGVAGRGGKTEKTGGVVHGVGKAGGA